MVEQKTMKGAYVAGKGEVRIGTFDVPEIKPNEALIKITACGVCPSDTRVFTGIQELKPGAPPRIAGHEWVGTVAELGDQVKGFNIGERVVVNWKMSCGYCYFCNHGLTNYCANWSETKGGFCDYGVGVNNWFFRIPDHVSDEEATFAEPLSCVVNGHMQANIRISNDVVVIGAGQIGIMHAQLARAAGARVIIIDQIDSRLEMAAKLGASVMINNSREDPVQKVKELTDGRGADSIIVAVGGQAVTDLGIKLVRRGGAVVLFASTYPHSEALMPMDINYIHQQQIILTGSRNYGPESFRIALKYIYDGTVQVKPLISHVLPFEQVQEGFDITVGRKGMKVVVLI